MNNVGKEVTTVSRKISCSLALVLLFTFFFTALAWASGEGEKSNGYYTIVTEKNKVILETALEISVGDSFYDDQDNEYKIIKIKGNRAIAKLSKKGKKISALSRLDQSLAAEVSSFGSRVSAVGRTSRPIAIYHTHSDESYIPSDGNFSIRAKGGIYKVGAVLAEGYKQKGAQVDHSYNVHDPHDGMAYERSRRTVVQLLKERPVTLFDVHRDAAPPQAYRKVVKGKTIAQMIFVIGNQNPNYQANLAYAKNLRDAANNKYPGLSKGILVTGGRFNQDLTPKDVLLEFGAHTNSRESAQRAAAMFADATASTIVGRTTTAPAAPGRTTNRPAAPTPSQTAQRNAAGGSNALLWIVGLAVLGGAFLLINEGSWEGVKARVRHFKNAEFAGYLGRLRKKDKEDGNNKDKLS